MNISVKQIPAEEWGAYAANAHLAVFGEILPPEYDRIDFALLAVDDDSDSALAYLTARELDTESVYLRHGGAFPPVKGKLYALPVYINLVAWLLSKYTRLTTLVENTNISYLKLAMAAGFRIIGIRNFKGTILVELFLERA